MIHVEVLPEEQRACLRTVGPAATALGFHLAGGTAVALHLGHRRSIDFDWFTGRFPVAAVDVPMRCGTSEWTWKRPPSREARCMGGSRECA